MCEDDLLLCDDGVSVSVDQMHITKGSLDDISRPASGEIRRPSPDRPRSLELLSPDVTHSEVQKLLHHVFITSGDGEN